MKLISGRRPEISIIEKPQKFQAKEGTFFTELTKSCFNFKIINHFRKSTHSRLKHTLSYLKIKQQEKDQTQMNGDVLSVKQYSLSSGKSETEK
jgi:hypothetical protein